MPEPTITWSDPVYRPDPRPPRRPAARGTVHCHVADARNRLTATTPECSAPRISTTKKRNRRQK